MARQYRVLYRTGLDVTVLTGVAYVLALSVRILTLHQLFAGSSAHVEIDGIHIHHMVPGLIVLLSGVILALIEWRRFRWFFHVARALCFGIGAAVVLDEFSLIVYLDPESYWTDPGLVVSAVAVTSFVVAIVVVYVFGRTYIKQVIGATVQAAAASVQIATPTFLKRRRR